MPLSNSQVTVFTEASVPVSCRVLWTQGKGVLLQPFTASKALSEPGLGRETASLLDPNSQQFKVGEPEFPLCR